VITILIPGSAGQAKTISIWSATGTLVQSVEVANSEVSKTLFVGEMPKGLYIIRMEMAGKIIRSKLILQ